MPYTSAQIVTLACQVAKAPNYTAQGGQFLNMVLSDLCQNFDLDLARQTFNFNFNVGTVVNVNYPNVQAGGGPYTLPSNYLRAKKGDVMWFNQGVPYSLIPVDIDEFDVMVQTAGNQAYPYLWATDMSQVPPVAIVWPGAASVFPAMVRYYCQMSDIGSGIVLNNWNPGVTTPELSTTIPWFPNQTWLIDRVAFLLMGITDDERYVSYETKTENQLRGYLMLKDDDSNRAKTVSLDRRRFGRRFESLPNTKKVGF